MSGWDPATSGNGLTGHPALVTLGYSAEMPGFGAGYPPGRLHDIEISDLTLWQIKNGTAALLLGADAPLAVERLNIPWVEQD